MKSQNDSKFSKTPPFEVKRDFTKVPNKTIMCRNLKPRARALLNVLLRLGYKDKFPSREFLANAMSVTENTVGSAMKELETRKIISHVRGSQKGQRRRSNTYIILPMDGWKLEAPKKRSEDYSKNCDSTTSKNGEVPPQKLLANKTVYNKAESKKKIKPSGSSPDFDFSQKQKKKETKKEPPLKIDEIELIVETALITSGEFFQDLKGIAARIAPQGSEALAHMLKAIKASRKFRPPKGELIRFKLIGQVLEAFFSARSEFVNKATLQQEKKDFYEIIHGWEHDDSGDEDETESPWDSDDEDDSDDTEDDGKPQGTSDDELDNEDDNWD